MSQFEQPLVDVHNDEATTSIESRLQEIDNKIKEIEDSHRFLKYFVFIWFGLNITINLMVFWFNYMKNSKK